MDKRPALFTRLFALVWISGLLLELSWSLLVHFPGFLSDLGASETRIGLLSSFSALIGLLLRPVLGRLMDSVGRRQVLLASGLLNVLAVAAMSLASEIGPFLIAVFVGHRVFQIAIFTAMLTLYADVLPSERRTQGLAIFGLGGLIPMATGGTIGDWFLDAYGFDSLFLASAAASLASWLMVWLIPRQTTTSAGAPRRGFWAALGQRDLLPVWLLTLLFAVGLEALFTFIRTYVDERQIGSVGLFFLLYGGAAIIVRIASNAGLDKVRHIYLISVSLAVYAVGLAGLGLAGSDTEMAVAAALLGLGHGLLFPVVTAQVVSRARETERGSAMAIFTSLFDLAVLTAAPVTGVLIDWRGYTTAFVGLGCFVAIGLVAYIAWERALETPSATSHQGDRIKKAEECSNQVRRE